MKKFLLAAALVVASLSANAQVYLGGGISLHSEDPGEGDTKTTINLVPELGYKLDDKLSIGVKLGYEHSKQGDKSSNDYTFEPYVRYTFAKWNKVGVFGEAGFGYTHFEDKVEKEYDHATVTAKTKANKWYIGVRPGVSIDVTNNLTFLTKIGWVGYSSYKLDADGAKAQTDLGLNLSGNNLQFSLVYNF